jgi:hypothetical protein
MSLAATSPCWPATSTSSPTWAATCSSSRTARLRELFRRFKVRPALRTLVRDLGRKLGEDVDRGRDAVATWKDQTEAGHAVPDGNDGLAVVRALAQWVLDYAAEGNDLGLPFDRPYLDLYDRCAEARRAVDTFLRRPPEDPRVHSTLRRVRDLLDPIVSEVPFAQIAHTFRPPEVSDYR